MCVCVLQWLCPHAWADVAARLFGLSRGACEPSVVVKFLQPHSVNRPLPCCVHTHTHTHLEGKFCSRWHNSSKKDAKLVHSIFQKKNHTNCQHTLMQTDRLASSWTHKSTHTTAEMSTTKKFWDVCVSPCLKNESRSNWWENERETDEQTHRQMQRENISSTPGFASDLSGLPEWWNQQTALNLQLRHHSQKYSPAEFLASRVPLICVLTRWVCLLGRFGTTDLLHS